MKPKVLIVDDTVFIRNIIKSIVEEVQFEVVGEAANGKEAVKKFKQLHPDIVVLDINMPGKDGIETLQEIKEINNQTKVIMVSAYSSRRNVIDAFIYGAKEFLAKPIDKERLYQVLKEFEFDNTIHIETE